LQAHYEQAQSGGQISQAAEVAMFDVVVNQDLCDRLDELW
jgi:hypothetical protein